MKKFNSHKILFLICFALLTIPGIAYASDFGGFLLFLYGLLAVVFAAVLMLTWAVTNLISKYWMRVSIRTAVFFCSGRPFHREVVETGCLYLLHCYRSQGRKAHRTT